MATYYDENSPKQHFEFADHSGGTSDDLDSVNHAILTGGEVAWVNKSYGNGIASSKHVFDIASTAAADGINVIVPVSNTDPGNISGRWLMVVDPICFGTPDTPFEGLIVMVVV